MFVDKNKQKSGIVKPDGSKMNFINRGKLRLILKSHESKLLKITCEKIIEATTKNLAKNATKRIIIKGPTALPLKRRIYCLLTSPHVNKDAREHFEIRFHK
jgi:small subunit ribosomal protein S10